MSIPVTFFSNAAKIRSLDYKYQALQKEADNRRQQLQNQLQNAFYQLRTIPVKHYGYYLSTALPNAESIISTATLGFKSGAISCS
ncbi:MAG: TolC family protein [Ignavibacteria bacterium]|nr:TolC family protein [Ignavibacteria bacterium]